MQYPVVLLVVLLGAAVADPMVLIPDDLKDLNKEISSKEYLKKILQDDRMVYQAESSGHDDILDLLEKLALVEAARLAEYVDLKEILKDEKLERVTLYLPTDEAVRRWMTDLPEALRPDAADMKQLVKAWIVPGLIDVDIPNVLIKSFNGAELRFNVYRNEYQDKIKTVNGARIIASYQKIPDVAVYVVDKVIYPIPVGDIIETLDEGFSEFIDHLKAVGETQSLKTLRPITVLVPTNDAFRALPAYDVYVLRTNFNKLQMVLDYHVIDHVRYSASLTSGQNILTRQGDTVSVNVEYGRVVLNRERQRSTVIEADIPTTNGVIHVIDQVMIPPGFYY